MSSAGLGLFRGIFVGLVGSRISIHYSLFGAATIFFAFAAYLLFAIRKTED